MTLNMLMDKIRIYLGKDQMKFMESTTMFLKGKSSQMIYNKVN